MAERTGRKPTPGRKHRSPRHKMAARIAPYSRGENHRRPGSTTARRSGGVCPIAFETRRGCCRWIRTPTIYVFLDVLRSIEERIVFITHDKLVSSPQAFSTIIEFNIYEDHAFLITNPRQSVEPLWVCRVSKKDSPKHATCGGIQRLVREGQSRWCVEESKSRFPKWRMKNRFMERGHILEWR